MNQIQMTTITDEDVAVVKSRKGWTFQVCGLHLVPNKLVAMLTFIMDMLVHDIRNVVFTVEPMPPGKKRTMAQYDEMGKTIIIDVQASVDHATTHMTKKTNYLGYRATTWINTIMSVLHELAHSEFALDYFRKTGKRHVPPKDKAWEEGIEARARELMAQLAKRVDIEVPDGTEWGWFAGKCLAIDKELANADEPWKAKQLTILHRNIVYLDERAPLTEHATLDEYYMALATEAEEATWPKTKETLLVIDEKAPLVVKSDVEIKAEAEASLNASIEAAKAVYLEDVRNKVNSALHRAENADVSDAEMRMFVAMNNGGMALEDALAQVGERAKAMLSGQEPATTATATVSETYTAEDPSYGMESGEEESWFTETEPATSTLNIQGKAAIMAEIDAKVAALKAQNAAAQTLAATAPAQQATLPQFQISQDELRSLMLGVYHNLYTHIFTKCEWGVNPDNGLHHFSNIGAVMEWVRVGTDPRLEQIIASMDVQNPDRTFGKIQLAKGQDGYYMRGTTTSGRDGQGGTTMQLPCYRLVMNAGDGVARKRHFIPQNPLKVKNNAYSANAAAAQLGSKIAYVFDGDVPIGQKGGFKGKFENGSWIQG